MSLSNLGQKSLSWVAAMIDWEYEFEETNSKVIFAGTEDNEETMNLQGFKED